MEEGGVRDESTGENSEMIVLDVRLLEMIHSRAFRAVLQNGHALVAYFPRLQAATIVPAWREGDMAKVRMSPFDMSRGELIIA